MYVKKFLDFISESETYDSLGEWIESISDDEYIMNIVNRYINDSEDLYGGQDIDSTIDLSNSINLLPKNIQMEIKAQVQNYLESGIPDKKPHVLSSTETESLISESLESSQEITVAGKGIFTSFLKSLTALGQKEKNPNWEKCPEDFLIYYLFENLEAESVKQIFQRFKSLERYLHLIDYGHNNLNLYFGIGIDGQFEYGISYEQRFPIGQFKLSKSVVKWILQLESKSAQSLKKELVNLSYQDLLVLGQIKRDMSGFTPGYFEKKLYPMLRDRVLTFGFYGIGKWDNGKLDEGEFQNMKQNFTNWLLSKRWGGKVLISVKPESFWVYFNVKLK